jgi:hypothetical protein
MHVSFLSERQSADQSEKNQKTKKTKQGRLLSDGVDNTVLCTSGCCDGVDKYYRNGTLDRGLDSKHGVFVIFWTIELTL